MLRPWLSASRYRWSGGSVARGLVQHPVRLLDRSALHSSRPLMTRPLVRHTRPWWVMPVGAMTAAGLASTAVLLKRSPEAAPPPLSLSTDMSSEQGLVESSNYPRRHFIIRVLRALRRFLETRVLEPLLTLTRAIHLLVILSPILFLSPIAMCGPRDPVAYGQERRGTLWWYDLIVGRMQQAGPTFVKLSQWAATRTDLFPMELCRRLSRLHSRAKAHPFDDTRKFVEEAFGGMTLEDIFSHFDPEPLGVGAIAQVSIMSPSLPLPPLGKCRRWMGYPSYTLTQSSILPLPPS